MYTLLLFIENTKRPLVLVPEGEYNCITFTCTGTIPYRNVKVREYHLNTGVPKTSRLRNAEVFVERLCRVELPITGRPTSNLIHLFKESGFFSHGILSEENLYPWELLRSCM